MVLVIIVKFRGRKNFMIDEYERDIDHNNQWKVINCHVES